jgi:hypothetical protein
MKRIEDARVVFFLEHEKLIREWAGLEKECKTVAQEVLIGCQVDLDTLARRLGGNATAWSNVVASATPLEGLILLHRPTWLHDGGIRAGIGLGWLRGATFAGPSRPYTGAYVDISTDAGKSLHGEIKSRLRLNGALQGTRYAPGTQWAAWRYEDAPEGAYWDDLQRYREPLVQAVSKAWDLMSGHVDAAVEAFPSLSSDVEYQSA